jgi:serine/threonine-protein kinase RsbW
MVTGTGTVTVSFTALPEHVRTARFIAASVARRAGVSEGLLDEIRLAVSEACSLAVRQHQLFAPTTPVSLTLHEDADTFSVQVADVVSREGSSDSADDLLDLAGPDDDGGVGDLRTRERIGLAVIRGLVDDVDIDFLATGTVVTMTWPMSGSGYDLADEIGNAPTGVL